MKTWVHGIVVPWVLNLTTRWKWRNSFIPWPYDFWWKAGLALAGNRNGCPVCSLVVVMVELCGFLELQNCVKIVSFNSNQFSEQYNVELHINITCGTLHSPEIGDRSVMLLIYSTQIYQKIKPHEMCKVWNCVLINKTRTHTWTPKVVDYLVARHIFCHQKNMSVISGTLL